MVIFMCNSFPKRLKELRISKGLKQTDLAEILDMSTRGYQYYESSSESSFREPNFYNLTKIADYFDVSVDYLLGRTDNPKINN